MQLKQMYMKREYTGQSVYDDLQKGLRFIFEEFAWISKYFGMDRDEILRLKQIIGLVALFNDVKFWRGMATGRRWII